MASSAAADAEHQDEVEEAPPRTVGIETGSDPSKATFTLMHEDHTLGNAVRYILAKNPEVAFAGYSVPHPSEPKMNIRVQTTGVPAEEAFMNSVLTLYKLTEHIETTFDEAIAGYDSRSSKR
mmetsp:Transcript_30395/g.81741  ORF Transcript_30395/g.81741 Transcript_30395/m.81741 type:complete len:122 (+) Transcript_30395:33-398(+)